jgi:hypothetical protein
MSDANKVVWDCPVPGGCSLKEPDLLLVFATFYIQIEVDEFGHPNETCVDEDTRLAVIAADIQLPGLVVRINPDVPGYECFRRIQLGSNGEVALTCTDHFMPMMDHVEKSIREFMTSRSSSSSSSSSDSPIHRIFIDSSGLIY